MTTAPATTWQRVRSISVARSLDALRRSLVFAERDEPLPRTGGDGPGRKFWKALAVIFFLSALVSEDLTPDYFSHELLYLLSVLAATLSLSLSTVILATAAGICGITFGLAMAALDAGSLWLVANRILSAVGVLAVGTLSGFLLRERQHSRQQNVVLRKVDVALGEKERRLENAERIGESGSWEVDLGRGTGLCSASFSKLFAMEPDKLCFSVRELLSLVSARDRGRLMRSIKGAMDEGVPVDVLHRLVRPDGQTRRVRTMAHILSGPQGLVLSGVTRDVTDRLVAEERIIDSEVHKRFAGQVARVGGWHYDRMKNRITWDKEAAAIRGLPPDHTARLEDAITNVCWESRLTLQSALQACLEDGRSFNLVVRILHPQHQWLRLNGEPVERGERIVGVRGALSDVTDLVEAQQETREMSSRLERTLDQMSEGFLLLDHDWRFSFLNRRIAQLVEAQPGDLLGKVIWEVFPAILGSNFEVKCREAVETGAPVRFSGFFAPLSKWLLIHAESTPDGLAVIVQDVTRQRADEEQLRMLSVATARSNDMIVISEGGIDDATKGPKIVYANESFERRTGFARDEVIGRTLSLLYGERTENAKLLRIEESFRVGQPCCTEITCQRKTGEAFTAELEFVPIIEGGIITHWVTVGRDISERKRFVDKLQLSEERFRLVTRATRDLVYDWNIESGNIWFSENAQEWLSGKALTPGEGQSPFDGLFDPEDRERVGETMRALQNGKLSMASMQYRLHHPQKGILHIMEDAFALGGKEGAPARIIGSLKDVTLLRAQQDQLREAQKLEATGRLTGGIAHDFNNLLTIIIGTAELIEDHAVDNPALKRLADTTIAAAERGSELTHHLLAFARRQPLAPQLVEVNGLIGGMRPLFLRALTESIELDITSDPAVWPTMVDKNQLESALLNLVINARDAMPGGGHLKIETGNRTLDGAFLGTATDVEPGAYVMIAVSDDGEGMTPEVVERAFEPFFTTKAVGQGSGMGLSMVYGFIKQSRGHVSIYSEPGEGTVVRLYLPRAEALAMEEEAEGENTDALAQGEHILVAEDDAMLRENVAEQLTSLGYRLTLARNGGEALVALQEEKDISLLFTDIVMPGGMNGRELADRARELRPELKVVYTSGYTQDARVQQGRAEASILFLSKPYRRRDLARTIREALEGDGAE